TMIRSFVALATVLALAGCEQESQPLPFDVSTSTTGQIDSQGGVVSSPAGVSIEFPAGAVSGTTDVEITPTDVPAAMNSSGSAISPAFRIEPVESVLSEPAVLELKFDANADPSRAWLASIVSV